MFAVSQILASRENFLHLAELVGSDRPVLLVREEIVHSHRESLVQSIGQAFRYYGWS